MKTKKRSYEPLTVEVLSVSCGSGILAASVVQNVKIMSVGQELGPVYDLSAEDGIDKNTKKTFSHEWEAGKDF